MAWTQSQDSDMGGSCMVAHLGVRKQLSLVCNTARITTWAVLYQLSSQRSSPNFKCVNSSNTIIVDTYTGLLASHLHFSVCDPTELN